MKKIKMEKTIPQENLDSLLERMVQKKVSELFYVHKLTLDKVGVIAETKEILTVKEVAILLGMDERGVRQKINEGLIPAYKPKFSNKFLVLKQDLVNEIIAGTQYKSLSMLSAKMNTSFDSKKYV